MYFKNEIKILVISVLEIWIKYCKTLKKIRKNCKKVEDFAVKSVELLQNVINVRCFCGDYNSKKMM